MRLYPAALAALVLFAGSAAAAQPASGHGLMAAPALPDAVDLPVGPIPRDRQEAWFSENGETNVRNVVQPTLTPVLPKGPATGTAVIVAPGGGFLGLAIENEGWKIAQWLAEHGIAAFVLKYRVLPTPADPAVFSEQMKRIRAGGKADFAPPQDTPPQALADGLAALRHVRANASRFGIDPDRIGFMGFSAGGFLTRSVVAAAGADMPAFAAPIYPNMTAMTVPANAPPMFVLIANDDFLLERGGLGLVESWRAAKKPIEFHLLASGGHGFGYGRADTPSEGWLATFHHWLKHRGLLEPAK